VSCFNPKGVSEKIFLQHIRDSQGIIIKVVNLYAADSEERRDYYQEILYQAWKSWPQFAGKSKFSTWLYRICLNTVLTSKRKKSRMLPTGAIDDTDIATDAPSHHTHSATLKEAIALLNDIDKALITLHLDGYEQPEIATIMGITPNNVRVKLFRIKNQLSKLIKDNLNE
jgi:RNA polymerase sigma-70 factor (ECF subfamily)